MADITNRIIDTLELRGADKYAKDMEKVAKASERMDRAGRRMKSPKTGKIDPIASVGGGVSDSAGMGGMAGRGGAALIAGAALLGLAKAATEAALASEKFKTRAADATSAWEKSKRLLGEAAGGGGASISIEIKKGFAQVLDGIREFLFPKVFAEQEADELRKTPAGQAGRLRNALKAAGFDADSAAAVAGMMDPNRSMQLLIPLRNQLMRQKGINATEAESMLGMPSPDSPEFKHRQLRDMLKASGASDAQIKRATGIAEARATAGHIPAPSAKTMREQEEYRKKGQDAFEDEQREKRRQRDFQRNLQIEQQIEMSKGRGSFSDLHKYVVGGGAQAGIGVTPVEMAAGGGLGARSNPTPIKIDKAGLDAVGLAMANMIEMMFNQAVRQGVLAPGPSR